jgi:hypothetical protein
MLLDLCENDHCRKNQKLFICNMLCGPARLSGANYRTRGAWRRNGVGSELATGQSDFTSSTGQAESDRCYTCRLPPTTFTLFPTEVLGVTLTNEIISSDTSVSRPSWLAIGFILSAFAQQRDTVSGLSGLLGITKEVVGIHALPSRSLFACDILRRFFQRVSLAKPTSAPLRF